LNTNAPIVNNLTFNNLQLPSNTTSKIGQTLTASQQALNNSITSTIKKNITSNVIVSLNVNIDWTMYSGNVRYQGICGACYTFATADTVASLNAINVFGFFVPLATQQVIDCANNGLTFGCDGGYLEGSYSYIQLKGITTEYAYPYKSTVSGLAGSCKVQGGSFKISSFKSIK
jgi:hypothetical protein